MSGVRDLISDAVHCSADNASAEEMADAILAALAAEGFSIVETGRTPVWSLETDDDALICRSGTKSITVRAKHATVFDLASVEPPKIVPVRALSTSPAREGGDDGQGPGT